jgi:Mlc titration factor MtfA (ptsG expression regulator)
MQANFILAGICLIAVLVFFYPAWRKRWLLRQPFPAAWFAIINSKLPFYQKLQPTEQRQLLDLIRLFLDAKTFHGCGGLHINDEIRVTIAAEACLLLLNRKTDIYPRLQHILVYPYAFRAAQEQHNPDGTVSLASRDMRGESWHHGKVILSWDDVEHGVADFSDGHNVVLHEFSHQLDSENGAPNGAPILRRNSIPVWANVLSKEFEVLSEAAHQQQPTVMDPYGATSPAEFFAVATETFFEKPAALEQSHPALYAELSKYYGVNPRHWQ